MKTKRLVLNGLFCALGVLLPQAFHMFGTASGMIFLPMHIPAIIAGFIIGPVSGLICGMISPIISCFALSMPTLVKMPFMAFEIGAYGFFCGIIFRTLTAKINNKMLSVYITLILTQICGRVINLLIILVAIYLLKLDSVAIESVWTSLITGIPGIIIQWIFIPPIVIILRNIGRVTN